MKEIAIQLRAMQLYAHAAHNDVHGVAFFGDHEFLGELYSEYETQYDATVERMIGRNMVIDHNEIERGANSIFLKTNGMAFSDLVMMETELRRLIESVYPTQTIGTQDLLATFADSSEQRTYKLGQRVR